MDSGPWISQKCFCNQRLPKLTNLSLTMLECLYCWNGGSIDHYKSGPQIKKAQK